MADRKGKARAPFRVGQLVTTGWWNSKKRRKAKVTGIRRSLTHGSGWSVDVKTLACDACGSESISLDGIDAEWFLGMSPQAKRKGKSGEGRK